MLGTWENLGTLSLPWHDSRVLMYAAVEALVVAVVSPLRADLIIILVDS